ncbi:hypothetical protein DWX64_03730 [Clostridium sp. AF20-17LB]|nr:hypothetical protein DWX64_03730 [Clostridium sp. AF20-17LB]
MSLTEINAAWACAAILKRIGPSLENIITEQFLAPQYPEVPLEQFSESPVVMLTPESSMYRRAAGQGMEVLPASFQTHSKCEMSGNGICRNDHAGRRSCAYVDPLLL